jgi:hypothetical protein
MQIKWGMVNIRKKFDPKQGRRSSKNFAAVPGVGEESLSSIGHLALDSAS